LSRPVSAVDFQIEIAKIIVGPAPSGGGVIASEAKQSRGHEQRLDCFVAGELLAMRTGIHLRDDLEARSRHAWRSTRA
jgi:hypothetical protein